MLLGTMLEEHFIRSMIKADGNLLAFVERPIAAGLALLVLLVWSVSGWLGWRRGRAAPRG
jgi:TctA family transporter